MTKPPETSSPDEGRQFTEPEVTAILRVAAERQANDIAGATDSTGAFSLSDLDSIAAEVGIDPRHIRAAVKTLDLRDEPKQQLLTGLPRTFSAVRLIEVPLSDRGWMDVVQFLESELSAPGVTRRFGEVHEWASTQHQNGIPIFRVCVEPSEHGTAVRMTQSGATPEMFGLVGATGFGGTGAIVTLFYLLGIAASPVGGLAFMGIGGLTVAGSRLWGRAWIKRRRWKMEQLLDRIEILIRSAARGAVPGRARGELSPPDPA